MRSNTGSWGGATGKEMLAFLGAAYVRSLAVICATRRACLRAKPTVWEAEWREMKDGHRFVGASGA